MSPRLLGWRVESLSPTADIRFLVNPSSAGGRAATRLAVIERAARETGASLHVTESPEDMRLQASRAVADGIGRLVVAGGDGSMHLVAQEIVGTSCALAPLAVGRGNDFARCLGVSSDLEAAVKHAVDGPVRSVDCGRAGPVLFVVHCGVGFDSESARWANQQRLARGVLSYPLSVLRTLIDFVPPRVRVEYEGGLFEGEVMFVVCANCWRFGGGMKIAPEASLEDGLLDVVIARRVSRGTLLRLLPLLYLGRHVAHPAVIVVKTPWVRLSLDRRMEMYGDGEAMLWVGEEPLDVRVQAGGLKVVGG